MEIINNILENLTNFIFIFIFAFITLIILIRWKAPKAFIYSIFISVTLVGFMGFTPFDNVIKIANDPSAATINNVFQMKETNSVDDPLKYGDVNITKNTPTNVTILPERSKGLEITDTSYLNLEDI